MKLVRFTRCRQRVRDLLEDRLEVVAVNCVAVFKHVLQQRDHNLMFRIP